MFPIHCLNDPRQDLENRALIDLFYRSPSNFANTFVPNNLCILRTIASTDVPRSLDDLSSSFQNISIDVEGIERELIENRKKDADLIRQDFIRNGIDSSVNRRYSTGNGVFQWPLNDAQNSTDVQKVCKKPERSAGRNQNGERLARRKKLKENAGYCVFCFNNGEPKDTYLNHVCQDERGFVMCPRLRKYVCPYCNATDKYAHTKKYCPKKPIITPADLEDMVINGRLQRDSSRTGNDKRSLRF